MPIQILQQPYRGGAIRMRLIGSCAALICLTATVAAEVQPAGEALPVDQRPLRNGQLVRVGDQHSVELIHIAPGKFWMGKDLSRSAKLRIVAGYGDVGSEIINAAPRREVSITKGFWMGQHKVPSDLFCAFLNDAAATKGRDVFVNLNENASIERTDGVFRHKPGFERCAVNCVRWDGAMAFCEWLSRKTGKTFRLPTEAEWEFTASGAEGRIYPGGNDSRRPKKSAGGDDDAASAALKSVDQDVNDTTPDGVVGMAFGRVGEWCSDYYGVSYLPEDVIDPKGPKKEQLPVKSVSRLIASAHG